MTEEAASLPPDPLALHRALGADSDEARDYLRKQSRLAELQIADLEREDAIRHRTLRIHHAGDLLKLALEIAAALVVLAFVAVIVAAVWYAAHDDGLVIEAFSVPADMAADGFTGQVVATRIQDRLAWMQARSDTIRAPGTYRNSWGDDIKVQIPNTGVSIGEFYRTLAAWLGHQTHITGEVVKTGHGLGLSVRDGASAAAVFEAGDLATLVAKASEEIYKRTQPYRHAVFLGDMDRYAEQTAALRDLAEHGAAEDRPWAWSLLGLLLQRAGDTEGALDAERKAVRLNPALPHAWGNLGVEEAYLGHDEIMFRNNRRALELLEGPSARALAPYAVETRRITTRVLDAEFHGDYAQAIAEIDRLAQATDYGGSNDSAPVMKAADLALRHDIAASRALQGGRDLEATALRQAAHVIAAFALPPLPAYQRAAMTGDWRAARDEIVRLRQMPQKWSGAMKPIDAALFVPLLADADARLGDFADAHALIDGAAADCYLCTRVRGNVAALQTDWPAAERWYARAARLAPSLPFAWLDWARMRAAKGDRDGAVAKLEIAHAKGPRFADPVELWGEVLVAQNRSDLAVAKFEEAARYAPHWKRLHRKWGEALRALGRGDDAAKQFTLARSLDD